MSEERESAGRTALKRKTSPVAGDREAAAGSPDTDSRLPRELKPLFSDYSFGRLRWDRDRDLVIGRVLGSGGLDAFSWLRNRAGDGALRDWLTQRNGGGLSPQRLRFLELVLGLPHRQVSSWIQSDSRKVWDERTVK